MRVRGKIVAVLGPTISQDAYEVGADFERASAQRSPFQVNSSVRPTGSRAIRFASALS